MEKKIEKTNEYIDGLTIVSLGDINELSPDFIVSLYCNVFDGNASGIDVLYYHRSEKEESRINVEQFTGWVIMQKTQVIR